MSEMAMAKVISEFLPLFPTEEDAIILFDGSRVMSAEDVRAAISGLMQQTPQNYRRAIQVAISDMTVDDVSEKLVYFMDEYFPKLIEHCQDDAAKTHMAMIIMEAVGVVKNASS